MAAKPSSLENIQSIVNSITSPKDARHAIETLRRAIRYHDYRYYILDEPLIADAEYDDLHKELRKLEKKFPQFRSPYSPTQQVGGKPRDELGTVRHPAPMLSLRAVYKAEAVRHFDQTCRETVKAKTLEYVAEPKYDGLSVELIYEDGKLITAATRGDGETGEDVLANVKTIKEIPLVLRDPEEFSIPKYLVVRGEAYMYITEFQMLNDQREGAGKSAFANPRNAVAGSVRQLDPGITANRPIHIFCYEITRCEGYTFQTHWEMLTTLPLLGLPVNLDYSKKCQGIESAIRFYERLNKARDDLPYEIDGVVYKLNNLEAREQMGVRQHDPRWALAYKFAPRQKTTTIQQIEVQVGRTGILTPVARLEPVHIGGVTIRRATLHNLHEIEKKDIRIGDAVLVERAGDVIPYIVKSIPERRDGTEQTFAMPESCPVCGGHVIVSEDKKSTQCSNIDCPAQLRERVIHFSSRHAMDIEGLGPKRVQQLIEAQLLPDLPALYRLTRDDLIALDRYADKSAENLLQEINESKTQILERFLYALGIPLVGVHLARVLTRHFETLEEVMQASQADLRAIDEIGPEVARSIATFFSENRSKVEDLLEAGIVLDNPRYSSMQAELPLQGETFVFTGELEHWTRSEAQQLVEQMGGRATSSVSSNTDYVVVGADPGSKLEEAQNRKIPVLNEQQFRDYIKKHTEQEKENPL